MSKIIQSCRQGFSLLEVLVSVFVVLIGLLGVATMIPAGRYEILQARKADMGADLSRAIVNSIVTQISNGWNPGGNNYYVVANDGGGLATKMQSGIKNIVATQCTATINDNRTFNGDDDLAIMDGDDSQFQLALDNGVAIGTGAYSACATIVSLGNGYYEITGLAVYRYSELTGGGESDASDYKRGSYIFCTDGSGKQRWYKIENINPGNARSGTTITTAAGDVNTRTGSVKYLGDVVGISRKVVRIDTYTPTVNN